MRVLKCESEENRVLMRRSLICRSMLVLGEGTSYDESDDGGNELESHDSAPQDAVRHRIPPSRGKARFAVRWVMPMGVGPLECSVPKAETHDVPVARFAPPKKENAPMILR